MIISHPLYLGGNPVIVEQIIESKIYLLDILIVDKKIWKLMNEIAQPISIAILKPLQLLKAIYLLNL